MYGLKLQDRISLALGKAAAHTGGLADAFRTTKPHDPLHISNRYLRLPATFVQPKGTRSGGTGEGELEWHGIFDASYTRPGDYIVLGTSVYFIATQEMFRPILCMRTTRKISVTRSSQQTMPANNPYGGYTPATSTTLLTDFPVALTGDNRLAESTLGLPTGQTVPYWSIQMPAPPGILLSPGDIIIDDLDRTAVIVGSNLMTSGWRINAKMATQ